MKEIQKSKKSIKKQKKKFDDRITNYQKHTFFILKENGEPINIKTYCKTNKLEYTRMCSVLKAFQINAEQEETANSLLLQFIHDSLIINEEKIERTINKIKKDNPKYIIENMDTFQNQSSVEIMTNYTFYSEKNMLRITRIKSIINKMFYNYLVKHNFMPDYRKQENWQQSKREAYNKKNKVDAKSDSCE